MHMMPGNFALKTAVELGFVFCELYLASPLAIAMYPQNGKVSIDEIEPEFKEWKNKHGQHMKEFMFNKGL
jgi:hypothetical protein